MRLLIAEDEKELSDALAAILQYNHYSVDVVYNGQDAYEYGLAENYDGIILDIMMPKLNGIEVIQRLRKEGIETPVLFLTAKAATEDKVLGLDQGADDYITKPFIMEELLARVRALTRRRPSFTANELHYGNIFLNKNNFELKCGEEKVVLNNKEFQILEMLMRNAEKVISTEQFLEAIWGYDTNTEINVVWVNISNLRKKLLKLKANAEIKAIRGVGYSMGMIQ